MAILKSAAGKLGSAIHKVGSALGNPLPDYNITESLQSYGGAPANQPFKYVAQNTIGQPTSSQMNYTPAPKTQTGGQILGAQTTGGAGMGTTQNQPTPPPTDQQGGLNPVADSGPSQMDLINQEFNNFQSFLGEQEGLARGRFADTESTIGREKEGALTDIGGQRDIRQQELEAKALSGREGERLNLSRVRQMLQELEQRDAARMAITGGGSMADATADRFGRTAQQSSAGVMQEGQRFANEVQMEQAKADQFYESKMSEVKRSAEQGIAQARRELDARLSDIDRSREAGAREKQKARYDSWQRYYSSVNEARLQAANFQAQYDMWKRQLDAQLAASQGYQPGNIAGQDFSQSLNSVYQAQGLGNPGVQSGMMEDPQMAATYFNRGVKPDEDENQAFSAIGTTR